MAVKYNNTTIDKIIYNGVEVEKVIYNGTVVFESKEKIWVYLGTTGSYDLEHELGTLNNAQACPTIAGGLNIINNQFNANNYSVGTIARLNASYWETDPFGFKVLRNCTPRYYIVE